MKYYNLEITVSPEHVFSNDVIGCCVLPNFYVHFDCLNMGAPLRDLNITS